MSLLKNQTSANPSLDFFGTGGGGGGGGPAISTIVLTTSSITTSTITANGPIYDSLSGDPTKPEAWSVGVDGNNFAYEALAGAASIGAYIDIRAESAPNTIVDYVRLQGYQGGGQVGYAPAPNATIEEGFRFFSSINGGPGGVYQVAPGTVYPLGGQLIPVIAQVVGQGEQLPVTNAFSTIAGHTYSVDFYIQGESTSATPNATDRIAYVVGASVMDSHLLSELSTLASANPRGRSIHGVFTASGSAAVVTANTAVGNSVSTTVVPLTTDLNGMLLRDLGPTNLIIAP